MVIYLAEMVCCQLLGEDVPRVLLDPPQFMLALLSMTDAEYQLWRAGIPNVKHLTDDMAALIQEVCIFFSSFSFILLFLYFCTS